jgi:uncharacterized protein YukJ
MNQAKLMLIPLDPENDWKNKIADQIPKDLLDIHKMQGNSIKKMKADQNGVFYVEEEISIDDLLKQF